jgi:hypothetical protein
MMTLDLFIFICIAKKYLIHLMIEWHTGEQLPKDVAIRQCKI